MSKHPPARPSLKHGLTLDLNNPPKSNKRMRMGGLAVPMTSTPASILTTPDVQRLILSSPEMAKFLDPNHPQNPSSQLAVNATGTGTTPQYLFPKTVTEEQEIYASGFEKALESMHNGETTKNGNNTTAAIATIEKATSAHALASRQPSSSKNSSSSETSQSQSQNQNQLPVTVAELPLLPASLARPGSGQSGDGTSSENGSITSLSGSGGGFTTTTTTNVSVLNEGVVVKEELENPDDLEEDNYSSTFSGDDTNSNGSYSKSSSSTSTRSKKVNGVKPINMVAQERIKLERKRARNRVAASRCRMRKLEKISCLEDKVTKLKGENSDLAAVVKRMKEAVCNLKQEVMEHAKHGCEIIIK